MGGSNSGSWYRWNKKMTVEECRRLDIRYLKKIGHLHSGCSGVLNFSRGGESTGCISYQIYEGRLELSFRIREHGEEWEDIKQSIRITETPCNFGGVRKWLECPNCERRVTTLCQGHKYYFCRRCYNLTYSSCREHKIERITRKLNKIKMKLGASPNSEWFPEKPKGMHWRTYDKLYNEYICLDDQSEHEFLELLMRF